MGFPEVIYGLGRFTKKLIILAIVYAILLINFGDKESFYSCSSSESGLVTVVLTEPSWIAFHWSGDGRITIEGPDFGSEFSKLNKSSGGYFLGDSIVRAEGYFSPVTGILRFRKSEDMVCKRVEL